MLTSTKSWYSSSPGEPDGPSGLFLRHLQRHRRGCSNPSSRVRLKMPGKTKNQRNFYAGSFGGRGWIRTTEAESSRFTVCPHWPLGNTPIFTFCVLRRTTCLFYHAERLLSTVFLPFSSNAFSVQRNGRAKAGKALQPCRHGKVGEKSQPEEIDKQIARKTRDNM